MADGVGLLLGVVGSVSGLSATQQLLIVVFGTITAPLVLNMLNTRRASKERDKLWEREDAQAKEAAAEREADIARQQAVADQAAQAADLLAKATADAAAKAEEARIALLASNATVAKLARESTRSTNSQLRGIHRLVNSGLVAAMRAELDSTVRLSAVLKELIAANMAAGVEPTAESKELLLTTDARIAELAVQVQEREELSKSVAIQIEDEGGPTPDTPPVTE